MPTGWRYTLVLVFAALVGVLLIALPLMMPDQFPRGGFWEEFVPRIGEAIVIATFIAKFVDDPTKRKLLKEFASDISSHMIGRWLPSTLREHIHEYLGVSFIRYNWQIEYRLEVLTGDKAGNVRLDTTSEYDIQNRSPFERKYPLGYDVEESWFPEIGETEITFVKVHDQSTGRDLLQLQSGNKGLKTKIEEGYVRLDLPESMQIEMPGFDQRSEHRFKFELKSTEYFSNSFYTPFDALQPVLPDTIITVYYNKSELKVGLYLTFADFSKATKIPADESDTYTKWTITKPILPGQGFIVRWNPLRASTTATHEPAKPGPETQAQ
jgi:hypothetical protein